jgi:hypothetical protein
VARCHARSLFAHKKGSGSARLGMGRVAVIPESIEHWALRLSKSRYIVIEVSRYIARFHAPGGRKLISLSVAWLRM